MNALLSRYIVLGAVGGARVFFPYFFWGFIYAVMTIICSRIRTLLCQGIVWHLIFTTHSCGAGACYHADQGPHVLCCTGCCSCTRAASASACSRCYLRNRLRALSAAAAACLLSLHGRTTLWLTVILIINYTFYIHKKKKKNLSVQEPIRELLIDIVPKRRVSNTQQKKPERR